LNETAENVPQDEIEAPPDSTYEVVSTSTAGTEEIPIRDELATAVDEIVEPVDDDWNFEVPTGKKKKSKKTKKPLL
jgi:hypothetical protein